MSVDRRKLIIEAASKSFSLFGYKATTMEQVAKLANVGKGTIYTFFTNKEELFEEILQELIKHVQRIAQETILARDSFHDNMHRFLYTVLEFRREHDLMIRMTNEITEMGTPAAKEGIRKVESAVLALLSMKIKEAIERGDLRPCDPERTAFAMFRMYLAFVLEWEVTHPPLEKEEIANLFDLYFVEGLAAR
ncbi:TetR/AcrR family transcriptional regulator [Paenibacillus sp. N1-5-1-14]|uniref:TetR/AcrR family transcriptional regulator n=1 Tax=Paenibacillus radicibacter TaxID=2972488 RepID=UPI002158E2AE|nr:TetR/AcrR family transcriptional regulator [Paenibacillus radicibacter]MCR8642078.1 TetR/AcrR family transcriptional regulator [Paenibacillus radicibacter]